MKKTQVVRNRTWFQKKVYGFRQGCKETRITWAGYRRRCVLRRAIWNYGGLALWLVGGIVIGSLVWQEYPPDWFGIGMGVIFPVNMISWMLLPLDEDRGSDAFRDREQAAKVNAESSPEDEIEMRRRWQ